MKKYKFRLAAYTDSAGKTNPEATRNGNEDNMFVCTDLSSKNQDMPFSADKEETLSKGGCLLVVADGMGGMNAGEVASEIAINVVKESVSPDAFNPAVLESTKTRIRFLESLVVKADSAIKEHAAQHPECEGMGSTIVMAWLYEGKMTVTWCGDSRAYLYRPEEGLRQISKDHSYVQGLVDEGKITMDEAFSHPYNNVITRSLGDMAQRAKPDSVTVPVFRGDIVMVNSDGLSGVLRDSEMESIISNNRQSMSSCRQALWKAAECADWYDNVTVILCEITDGTEYTLALAAVGEKDYNKSFINLRISRKVLKIALGILAAFLVCGILCLIFRPFQREDKEEIQTIEEQIIVEENTPEISVPETTNDLKKDEPRRPKHSATKARKEPSSANQPVQVEIAAEKTEAPLDVIVDSIRSRLTPVRDSSVKTQPAVDTTRLSI